MIFATICQLIRRRKHKGIELTMPGEGRNGGREDQKDEERPARPWRRSRGSAGHKIHSIKPWNHQCSLLD